MQELKSLLVPFLIVLCHIALILLQPDFGSTLVYFPVLLGMLYVAGASFLHLFVILFYGLIAGAVITTHVGLSLVPDFLQDHAAWNFIYKATQVGREFLIVQGLIALSMALIWWFCRQFRLRIPGIFF